MLLALSWLGHCFRAYFFYKAEAHVCYRGGSVHASLFFHLLYYVFEGFFFVVVQIQFIQYESVALG